MVWNYLKGPKFNKINSYKKGTVYLKDLSTLNFLKDYLKPLEGPFLEIGPGKGSRSKASCGTPKDSWTFFKRSKGSLD